MSVEVERKFVCDADIQKRLEEVGGVFILHTILYSGLYTNIQ